MKYNYCLQFYAVLILEIFLVFENSDHSWAGNNRISSRLHKIGGSFWPDGLVPYELSSNLSDEMVSAVEYAVDYMNTVSCVKWELRRPIDNNYVTFQSIQDSIFEPTCASEIGMILGKQSIDLGHWCFQSIKDLERKTTVVHEMMHAMGFFHEHQRPDRDCYVVINSSSINELNFEKLEKSDYEYDSPYDFHSIMQYNGVRFIRPVFEFKNIGLGRADGKLSPIDIVKVRHLYCGEPSYCNRSINMNLCEGERNRVKRNQCEN